MNTNDAYVKTKSLRKAGALLGVCAETVRQRLLKQGMYCPQERFYSAEEDAAIAAWAKGGRPWTHMILPGRSSAAVCRRARALGVFRSPIERTEWSAHEIDVLRSCYRNETASAIAHRLGRTRNEIIGKARRMGLTKRTIK